MSYTPQYLFKIAALASGSAALVNVEVDGTGNYTAPKWEYYPNSQELVLGDGTVRGGGWATAQWHWDVMTEVQRDWLRTFCPGQSAEVYIQTPMTDNAEALGIFYAVMIWPTLKEQHVATRRLDHLIRFQHLIYLGPGS